MQMVGLVLVQQAGLVVSDGFLFASVYLFGEQEERERELVVVDVLAADAADTD